MDDTAPATAETLTLTKSLCGHCKQSIDASIVRRGDQIWMDKTCATHGAHTCLVASSAEWYFDCLEFFAEPTPPGRVMKPVAAGCPFDCGPCTVHQQKVYLPVIPITSACNLDCPICYTVNRNESAHEMSAADFQRILEHLVHDHEELDIINFTGGEPTLHPGLLDLLEMARAAGIRRLTVSTNGIRLLDEDLVRRLAALGARVILSLDSLRVATDKALLGANTVATKLKVLDLLAKHEVTVTILPAVAGGYNDDEVGALLDLVLSRPHVCSLELHPLTFTGQGGSGFDRRARITTPDLHRRIEEATDGRIGWRDFVPSPLAHPHCYSIAYLLMLDGGGYIPLTRLTDRQTVFDLLRDSLYLEPREHVERLFRDIVDTLWASPDCVPESQKVLETVKRLLNALFPDDHELTIDERRRVAERAMKAIYIHAHMDEENFDTARVMRCPVGVPEVDGTNIPTCSYNVIYREKDPRFRDPAMLRRMGERRPALNPGPSRAAP